MTVVIPEIVSRYLYRYGYFEKDLSSSRKFVEFPICRNYSPFEIHDGELKEHKIKNRYNMNFIFKPN